jgi:GNAT superfamily N-acetyltransferase
MSDPATQVGDGSDVGRRDDPADTTDEFPCPPVTFADGEGRPVEIRGLADDDRSALVSLYDAFDPADRAQGLPPGTRAGVESWLADICETGVHTVAWHDERAVGHACLVPTRDARHELAIFVAGDYQHAGIGTRLLRCLLGQGAARGVERVWLVVQPRNTVARRLYESTGFDRAGDRGGLSATDVEMERRL